MTVGIGNESFGEIICKTVTEGLCISSKEIVGKKRTAKKYLETILSASSKA